jgi:peptide-methionine (S)-S-oxide reductase
MPTPDEAPAGRSDPILVPAKHYVNGNVLQPPFPPGLEIIIFGMGCFWGAERSFWKIDGVNSTAVGYTAGYIPNPTYEEVCSGLTGHNEVVRVVFNPKLVSVQELVKVFWEGHDPTQDMRQGNDVGTQYRSGIYTVNATQLKVALGSSKFMLKL